MTVTDLKTQLNFARGTYNILDCGVRTGKTFWALNNLQSFTRDGKANRILYLVDTISLKDSIVQEYPEVCQDADVYWRAHVDWGLNSHKIGVMCYQAFGNQLMKGRPEFLDHIDCICWDECDSIFDFAAAAFAKARKTDFAREDISNAEILSIIQRYSTRPIYMPLVLLGEWERIVNEGRIMCIGLSATPERARLYYRDLVSSANQGRIENMYRAAEDIFFHNLRDLVRSLKPLPGAGYWCYSPWIKENQNIVALANSLGFHAIELHSSQNEDVPMTEEQTRVSDAILATGMVPPEYDFVIVNKAYERGYNIYDTRFNQLIVNSCDETEREQASRMVFPHQRMLKTFLSEVPGDYVDRWLTMDECRELAASLDVREAAGSNRSRVLKWNKLKDLLPQFGYEVRSARRRPDSQSEAQQMYFISGTWHDAPLKDGAFMALAEAKK